MVLDSFLSKSPSFIVNKQEYFESGIPNFIKKVLVYLTMIVDNMKNFVQIKSNGKIENLTRIDPQISKINEIIIKTKIEDKGSNIKEKFQIDLNLVKLSLEELANNFQIDDLMLFLKISQINFPVLNSEKFANGMRKRKIILENLRPTKSEQKPENPFNSKSPQNGLNLENLESIKFESFPKNFSFSQKNNSSANAQAKGVHVCPESSGDLQPEKCVEFIVREYEIDEIILAKRKRTDEKLKHSFRAVCLGIKQKVRKDVQIRGNGQINAAEMNLKLTRAVFGKKSNFDWVFESKNKQNITKTLIDEIKKCGGFARKMNEYIYQDLIKDEIENNILNKSEKIMNSDLTCKGFLTLLMTKTKKNGWILQNSLNSIDEFLNCKHDTILKIKQRKKNKKKMKVK